MYLVFDIETVINKARVIDTETRKGETPNETFERIVKEACEHNDACFVPARFHDPVVAVLLLLTDQFEYQAHWHAGNLTDSKAVTVGFWSMVDQARNAGPLRLVSCNGIGFDLPVMQVSAMAHRVPIPGWLMETQVWKDPRGGVNGCSDTHLDLLRFLAGPGRIGGGLNFWARLLGLPGKVESVGSDVDGIVSKYGIDGLVDYCYCDVANTYGILLETMYSTGKYPVGHRNPSYLAGVKRLFHGRGSECTAFLREYEESLINSNNPLF